MSAYTEFAHTVAGKKSRKKRDRRDDGTDIEAEILTAILEILNSASKDADATATMVIRSSTWSTAGTARRSMDNSDLLTVMDEDEAAEYEFANADDEEAQRPWM